MMSDAGDKMFKPITISSRKVYFVDGKKFDTYRDAQRHVMTLRTDNLRHELIEQITKRLPVNVGGAVPDCVDALLHAFEIKPKKRTP